MFLLQTPTDFNCCIIQPWFGDSLRKNVAWQQQRLWNKTQHKREKGRSGRSCLSRKGHLTVTQTLFLMQTNQVHTTTTHNLVYNIYIHMTCINYNIYTEQKNGSVLFPPKDLQARTGTLSIWKRTINRLHKQADYWWMKKSYNRPQRHTCLLQPSCMAPVTCEVEEQAFLAPPLS